MDDNLHNHNPKKKVNDKPSRSFVGENRRDEPKGYIVQNKDADVLKESTSGGAFTAIAKYVLNRGGVVFGVELTDDLTARHTYVETEDDLSLFRNSKYVQSIVGDDTFKLISSFLKQGRFVCFSGTPCQVAGLKSYLGVEYENLILVDVVCRAVPSPLIFRQYIDFQEKVMNDNIKHVRFRDKWYGYKYSTLNLITDRNSGNYHEGIDSDPWLRTFFSNICDRPSCHECRFRGESRVSDITIWDCFDVGKFSKELDNDKGASRVLLHTEKGKTVFEEIRGDLLYTEVDSTSMTSESIHYFKSPRQHQKRDMFFADAKLLDSHELFNKYFSYTFRIKVEHSIRLLMVRLGIYSSIRKFASSLSSYIRR